MIGADSWGIAHYKPTLWLSQPNDDVDGGTASADTKAWPTNWAVGAKGCDASDQC